MSGLQSVITAGCSVVDEDGQRMADAAAHADDLALEAMISPTQTLDVTGPSARKLVIPVPRHPIAGGTPAIPERLVRVGAIAGTADILAFKAMQFEADPLISIDTAYHGAVTFAARSRAIIASALFAANASGSPRTDLVYATIQRSVSLTGVRRVKDLTSGSVSTQTVNLATEPAVTITVLPATTIAGLPADTATVWNVALAEVVIPNGYALNGALTQSWITQAWRRGGVGSHARHDVITNAVAPAAIASAYSAGFTAAHRALRLTSRHVRRYLINLSGANDTALIDDTLDLRRRIIEIKTLRGADEGAGSYPAVDAVTLPGSSLSETTGLKFTGDGNSVASADGGKLAYLVGNGAGLIPIAGALYMFTFGATAGCYVVEVEFSDRLDE